MIPVATYEEGKELIKGKVCGECQALLTLYGLGPPQFSWAVGCTQNKEHMGLVKVKSLSQVYDEGGSVPLIVANKIEQARRRKAGGKQ